MSQIYKIYREGNYIRVVDVLTNELFNGAVKDVFIDKSNVQKNEYTISKIKDFDETNTLSIGKILKSDDTAYSISEWETFYTENTGNFNGGGAAPETLENKVNIYTVDGTGEKYYTADYINETTATNQIANTNFVASALTSYANISLLPKETTPTKALSFDNAAFSTSSLTPGDTGSNYYGNIEGKVTEECILNQVQIRASASSTATIRIYSILSSSGTSATVSLLHTYSAFSVTSGTNTYTITDTYKIPKDAFITIKCNNLYYSSAVTANNLRITLGGVATLVTPNVSVNYKCLGYNVANDIATNSSIDAKNYIDSTELTAELINIPKRVDTSKTVSYNNEFLSTASLSGGDLPTTYYANGNLVITNTTTLKNITLKTTGSGTADVAVYKIISSTGGNATVQLLHNYPQISVSAGTNTYNISDTFTLQKDNYIAVKCATLNYVGSGIGTINLRFPNTISATFSNVILAYQFETYGTQISPNILTSANTFEIVQPTVTLPKKIYTVANNINPSEKGFSRNYSASIYLDHCFDGFLKEYDINFTNTKSDKYIFSSPINVTDSNDSNPTVVYNDDNSNVKTYTKSVTIGGMNMPNVTNTVKHISTLATVGASTLTKVLCIGDSVTYGELAKFPGDAQIQSYSLLVKQLFEMDKTDSSGSLYNSIIVGTQKRTLDYTYKSVAKTITACHEGIRGWTIDQYLANTAGNRFWDSATSKFSIKKWLDNYRTMDDAGVRLSSGSPTKGALVTDVNAFDVSLPTHIVIMLGANGNDTSAQFITKLNTLISTIKQEYVDNSWGAVKISFNVFDSAGTYFPSKHPKFDDSICFWNDLTLSRHARMYGINKEYMAVNLVTDNEDATGVYHLPAYWTMPTAESAVVRQINLPNSRNYFNNNDVFVKYGWVPTVHLNPDAHWSFAYQLYSWMKYTLSL